MLEVKQHHQDSGHVTLPSCYPQVNEGDRAGTDIPCPTFSCHLRRQPGEVRTAPLHWNNPHSSLAGSELPHSLEGSWFSLHLYQKVNLMSLKEIIKNLCSQLSCYNKNSAYEPNFLLFCVCLGNLEQNNTGQSANISSEATGIWKSSEAQKETLTALCYQSARAQTELAGAQQQLWTLILYLKPSGKHICTRAKGPLTSSSPVDP